MPITSKASNALYAKCRAMFGKRLTQHDIDVLLNSRSLSEIAVYLKSNTRYAPALANVDERLTHRGQLELELHRILFGQFEGLCRYEISVGEHLADFVLNRMELKQYLSFLQFLNSGHPQDYIFSLPYFFEKHTNVKLMELSQQRSFSEFLEHIKKSIYYDALKNIKSEDCRFDYFLVENLMYSKLYDAALSACRKYYSGDAQTQLLDLFGTEIELHNVASVYRLKKYYKSSPEFISSVLYPYSSRISRRVMAQIAAAETADDALDIFLRHTPYRREVNLDLIKRHHIDNVFRELRYKRAHHYMHFSTNPSVVLLSYMILTETELTEIITIIEGVRYGLDPERISELIVMDNY